MMHQVEQQQNEGELITLGKRSSEERKEEEDSSDEDIEEEDYHQRIYNLTNKTFQIEENKILNHPNINEYFRDLESLGNYGLIQIEQQQENNKIKEEPSSIITTEDENNKEIAEENGIIEENKQETPTTEELKQQNTESSTKKTQTVDDIFNDIYDNYLDCKPYEEIINKEFQKEEEDGEKERQSIQKKSVEIRYIKTFQLPKEIPHHQPSTTIPSSHTNNINTIPNLFPINRLRKRRKFVLDKLHSLEEKLPVEMNNFNKQVDIFQNVMSSHYNFTERIFQTNYKNNFLQSYLQDQEEMRKQLSHFRQVKLHEKMKETFRKWSSVVNEFKENFDNTNREKKRLKMLQLAKDVSVHMHEIENKKRKEKQEKKASQTVEITDKVLNFWKKHEKEIAEKRKRKKKEEEERVEALRQQRKLNFLLSQTELYSHFMGKKVIDTPTKTSANGTDNEDIFSTENAKESAWIATEKQRQLTEDFDKEVEKFRGVETSDSIMEDQEEELLAHEPNIFNGKLKKYQLKGMRWLISLYDQGINGILADEMGLGKTIQTIAFLAYLAEKKSIWGPTLIISPSSTLHNWQQEFEKFCPMLKVLPYWGSLKDRKVLRKYWTNPDKLYQKESPFHIVISSYGLILEDEKYFKKVRWQYLILDEAHAIKSSKSQRWKTLLGFKCRNRMLLTGTPIQNNMKELWALLHFIMPSLFDSHEEFNDWFSKDIESHASKGEKDTKLNEQQLARLHLILKPFMLRRVKKDVESEMAPKTEVVLSCPLSRLQDELYTSIRHEFRLRRSPSSETTEIVSNTIKEMALNKKSLENIVMQLRKTCNHPHLFPEYEQDTRSPFSFALPMPYIRHLPVDITGKIPEERAHLVNPLSYHIPKIIFREILKEGSLEVESREINLFKKFNFVQNLQYLFHNFGTLFHFGDSLRNLYKLRNLKNRLVEYRDRKKQFQFLMDEILTLHLDKEIMCCDLLIGNIEQLYRNNLSLLKKVTDGVIERAVAPPINIYCSDNSAMDKFTPIKTTRFTTPKFLYNNQFVYDVFGSSQVALPSISKLIAESGKLRVLDQLLSKLKQEGHRVLIFCQMTRMLDILEEYMYKRRYSFFRLDGSTPVAERRDMVESFQNQKVDPVFAFILSTKAGGLGITLTAADTVIFFESDWNPTSDAQAMDRVHRIGQTKPVTVYRLIVGNSVEDRILKIAQQKSTIQETVYKGQFKMQEEEENVQDEMEDEDGVASSSVVVEEIDLNEKEMISLLL
ncbi:hypothetical protein ABK040_006599 [Willaertia magna]